MKNKLFIIAALVLLFGVNAFAQGGKAEPSRLSFAKGKSSVTVSDKVYGDIQAEYVFSAKEGQSVKIAIASTPSGRYAAFKVLNSHDSPEFTSEHDVNYNYAFKAPYTGDYLIWVTFRPAGKVKSAKYRMTLSIK